MRLLVQIPCLNEEDTIAEVIKRIPRNISYLGVSEVKVVLLDDASADRSVEIAQAAGADYLLRSEKHLGLAQNYNRGLRFALDHKFDLLVNLDGDLQYYPEDIPKLVQPLIAGEADLVFGVRDVQRLRHMSNLKKRIHWLGCRFIAIMVGQFFSDPVTGFRALNSLAMRALQVRSVHTYTVESLFLAHRGGLMSREVAVRVKPTNRGSRLIKNIPEYVARVFYDIIKAKLGSR
jgi:glycosyltransferase involved in cell wall biosynthesis